ncbi:hypothetical protein T484DRAFT_1833542 [Baffinella frigidus]|nr:hypothetical protein T484DRAFT_1833542 [Cryptophyta sp. CCMP2293]
MVKSCKAGSSLLSFEEESEDPRSIGDLFGGEADSDQASSTPSDAAAAEDQFALLGEKGATDRTPGEKDRTPEGKESAGKADEGKASEGEEGAMGLWAYGGFAGPEGKPERKGAQGGAAQG